MRAEERRQAIRELLQRAKQPVSATAWRLNSPSADRSSWGILPCCGRLEQTSRYARGYVILRETGGLVRQVAVQHDAAGWERS